MTIPKTPEQRSERRSRLIVTRSNGTFTLRLKDIQALDHSDTCLLKEWMTAQKIGAKITLNLKDVQYLPSGFFGMLHEIVDLGQSIKIINTSDQITKQVWYTRFVTSNGDFVIPDKPWVPTRD